MCTKKATRPGRLLPEDNRTCGGRCLCRLYRSRAADCRNHVHLTANQIGRQGWKSIVLPLRPAIFDRDVLALDIAAFAQMG